jgi:hypothetical protein
MVMFGGVLGGFVTVVGFKREAAVICWHCLHAIRGY